LRSHEGDRNSHAEGSHCNGRLLSPYSHRLTGLQGCHSSASSMVEAHDLGAVRRHGNRTRVWNPRYEWGRCYHSGFPGWKTVKCVYWITNGSPYSVKADIQGEFHNRCFGIDYQQHTWNKARSDDSFVIECHLGHGSLPVRWSGEGQGGRQNV